MNKGAKMEIDLKPCPFCGEKPKVTKAITIHDFDIVECINDHCELWDKFTLEAWNTRPPSLVLEPLDARAMARAFVDYENEHKDATTLEVMEHLCQTFGVRQVKLPEKKSVGMATPYSIEYAKGWDAALDKVREMNGES